MDVEDELTAIRKLLPAAYQEKAKDRLYLHGYLETCVKDAVDYALMAGKLAARRDKWKAQAEEAAAVIVRLTAENARLLKVEQRHEALLEQMMQDLSAKLEETFPNGLNREETRKLVDAGKLCPECHRP